MIKKFSLGIEESLRKKVKATAALNDFDNMNEFIVKAIEEKIERIENKNPKHKTKVNV